MNPNEGIGWAMFALSGVLFLISGIRSGDWLTIAGAIVWLMGCGVFVSRRD